MVRGPSPATIIAKLPSWDPLPSCSDISYSLGGRTASLPTNVIEAGATTRSVTSMASILRLAFQIILLCLAVILESAPVLATDAVPRAPVESAIGDYRLGAGDKIRVTVFGENDLGGEFVVDGSGYVRLPLIGEVKAAGLSARNFETEVETQLKDGYLKEPRVNVEVTTYRPFYILGEVNRPGPYPYVNGMTVLNAVALAGGFTYRANENVVLVRRSGQSKEERLSVDQLVKVYPDDIITVRQRFF
jgi:protein involved in polysaccharide export with SLBB domain